MGIFSGNQKDDKVANLESEAQERNKRIAELRAQISNLKRDEEKVQSEYNAVQSRIVAHRKRSESLSQLKTEETTLIQDIKQREEKQADLITELEQLQETRRCLMSQIAPLRSRVENEKKEAKKDSEEVARLEKILSDNAARKQKILEDTESQKKTERELKSLEEKRKEIKEGYPLVQKKYEETKRLVDEMEKNETLINQSIQDIWKKLQPDTLDRLIQDPR